jgi:hypothetical protein
MKNNKYKVKHWDTRNVVVNSDGKKVVRPSFKHVVSNSGITGSEIIIGAFSVLNGRTGDHYHYTIDCGTGVTFSTVTNIRVWDHFWNPVQTFAVPTRVPPSSFSYAVVEDSLLIGFPSTSVVGGLVGGNLYRLTLGTPVNPNTASLTSFPRGLVASWAGRSVVADGNIIYFSDAIFPVNFTGANTINAPSEYVWSLHTANGGSLVIVTSAGVYGLPESASWNGQGGIVSPMWEKLSDYGASNYNKTTVYKGRVYGLTQNGYTLVDREDQNEVYVSEQAGSRTNFGKISFPDYREGKMFAWSRGIIISIGRFSCMVDLEANVISWWSTVSTTLEKQTNISGVMREADGSDVFVVNNFPCILNGNDITLETVVTGIIAGRIDHDPSESPVIRQVSLMANAPSESLYVAINDKVKSTTFPTQSPLIGTDTWASTTVFMQEDKMRSRQLTFAERGDELFIEVGVTQHPTKIPEVINIEFAGVGRRRPSK